MFVPLVGFASERVCEQASSFSAFGSLGLKGLNPEP